MPSVRFFVVISVMVAVIVTGIILKSAYEDRYVSDPLESDLLQIPGVTAVDVTGDKTEVRISLSKNAELPKIYPRLVEVTGRRLGEDFGEITLLDRPSPTLEQTWEAIHLSVWEAGETNGFTRMKEQIDAVLLGIEDVSAQVAVDRNHIFVTLIAGDDYLFSVVPRRIDSPS